MQFHDSDRDLKHRVKFSKVGPSTVPEKRLQTNLPCHFGVVQEASSTGTRLETAAGKMTKYYVLLGMLSRDPMGKLQKGEGPPNLGA